jgi:hypothetical protein
MALFGHGRFATSKNRLTREKQTLMLSALVELCSALTEIDAFESLIFGRM